ncbi:MAG TPA: response regulator, partial [Salinarimonas sp.]|nr:response regulator [Salinarimonas sp.]
MADDDVLDLIDDDPLDPRAGAPAPPWVVAFIDDDPAVHQGTRFALADYVLHDQRLEILSAYSAEEGRRLLTHRRDIAVILLDVVMESDSAGLDFVDYVRRELKDETVRIILRTGQPGQAPERRVIVRYDINDYKAKT